jgi:hypothetical protein
MKTKTAQKHITPWDPLQTTHTCQACPWAECGGKSAQKSALRAQNRSCCILAQRHILHHPFSLPDAVNSSEKLCTFSVDKVVGNYHRNFPAASVKAAVTI